MTKKIALSQAAMLAATILASITASARPIRGQAASSTMAYDASACLAVQPDPGRHPAPFASGLAHAGEKSASRAFGGAHRTILSIRGSVTASASTVRASDFASTFAGTSVHGGEVIL